MLTPRPVGGHPVSSTISNTASQMVRELFADHQPPGFYDVTWNGWNQEGKPVASGVYIYRLIAEGLADARKLMLIR